MELVDEQDDTRTIFCSLLNLIEDGLYTLLILALVLRTRHEGTHIKGVEARNEGCGNIAIDDTLCETLCDSGLAYTGFTNENWVVLGPAAH